jgi:hypothetical protein
MRSLGEDTDNETAVVGTVTLRASGHCGQHGADPGRVPAGAGFWSGDVHEDLCSYCWQVVRDDPHRAPTPEEEIHLAAHGIGSSLTPCFVQAGDEPADVVARLDDLVEAGVLPRVALDQGPHLGGWLEAGGELPDGAVVRRDGVPMQFESMPLRHLELQLRGELRGPPLDADLLARLEAATDDRGIVRDADLANEYHLALVERERAARVMRGDPEPIIEQGRVFPSTPEDDAPLG